MFRYIFIGLLHKILEFYVYHWNLQIKVSDGLYILRKQNFHPAGVKDEHNNTRKTFKETVPNRKVTKKDKLKNLKRCISGVYCLLAELCHSIEVLFYKQNTINKIPMSLLLCTWEKTVMSIKFSDTCIWEMDLILFNWQECHVLYIYFFSLYNHKITFFWVSYYLILAFYIHVC